MYSVIVSFYVYNETLIVMMFHPKHLLLKLPPHDVSSMVIIVSYEKSDLILVM